MKRRAEQILNAPFAAGEAAMRRCAWDGCEEAGIHRAPRSRERLDDFLWFCLEHVRDYNGAWDYYRGRSAEEIEADRRRDGIWQRPTWRLGGQRTAAQGRSAFTIHDRFGFFEGEDREEARHKRESRRRAMSDEEKALDVLGLDLRASFSEVKARYKQLVKRLHPDANGGDRAAEEQLKTVNQAYSALKNASRARA